MGPIGWIRRRFGPGDPVDDEPTPEELSAPAEPGDLLREGERIELRRQIPANQAAFQRWYADDEIASLLRHDQKPLNAIQSRGYFQTIILPLTARDMAYALHEKETGRLIGASALTDFGGRGRRHAYFRIVIGEKDTWGKGYGTEATRLVVLDGFERHALDEVRLEVFLENERARAAYDRVGFVVTGEHIEFRGRGNPPLEVVEMAIVREDFDDALAEDLARQAEEKARRDAELAREEAETDAAALDEVNGELAAEAADAVADEPPIAANDEPDGLTGGHVQS